MSTRFGHSLEICSRRGRCLQVLGDGFWFAESPGSRGLSELVLSLGFRCRSRADHRWIGLCGGCGRPRPVSEWVCSKYDGGKSDAATLRFRTLMLKAQSQRWKRSWKTPPVSTRVVHAMRSQLRQIALICLTAISLAVSGLAQQPAHQSTPASLATRKRIFVDGKPIPASRVIVKDGVSYADASLLAEALGAYVQSGEGGLTIVTSTKPRSCAQTSTAAIDFRRSSEAMSLGSPTKSRAFGP